MAKALVTLNTLVLVSSGVMGFSVAQTLGAVVCHHSLMCAWSNFGVADNSPGWADQMWYKFNFDETAFENTANVVILLWQWLCNNRPSPIVIPMLTIWSFSFIYFLWKNFHFDGRGCLTLHRIPWNQLAILVLIRNKCNVLCTIIFSLFPSTSPSFLQIVPALFA